MEDDLPERCQPQVLLVCLHTTVLPVLQPHCRCSYTKKVKACSPKAATAAQAGFDEVSSLTVPSLESKILLCAACCQGVRNIIKIPVTTAMYASLAAGTETCCG
jgi:hypothetical protein